MLSKESLAKLTAAEINKNADAGNIVTEEQLRQFLESFERSDRIVHTDEIRAMMALEGKIEPTSTGVEDLDDLIGGFYPGQVIVLTARPKSGKTEMGLFFIGNLMPEPVLFLGLEQNARELMEQRDEQGYTTPEFYSPLDTSGIVRDTNWLHLKIIETKFKTDKKLKVAVIDHFGYITAEKAIGDAYTFSVISTMQRLKGIAAKPIWH